MLKIFNRSISLLLAVIMVCSAFALLFTETSSAMPRIENKLILDTDPDGGYVGEYLIAYNPAVNSSDSITTGVISDQMKNVDFSTNSKSDSSQSPYIVPFKQRVSASDVKRELNSKKNTVSSLNSITAKNKEYAVGDVRYFNIYADLNDAYLSKVDFTLAAIGEHCYIWIITGEQYALTSAQAADMAFEYDEVIYDEMLTSFGEHIDPDESGRLNILVYNIQDGFEKTTNGYTCGYFSYSDIYPEDEYGNNAAMIHVDTYPTIHWKNELNWQDAYSTIVHELQHLINFTQYLSNPLSAESDSSIMATWLNECCSMAAEEMIYPNSVAYTRLAKLYDSQNIYTDGKSIYSWEEDIINYAMMYLFGQYIRLQTDGYTAFKAMLDVYALDPEPTEAKAVEAAVEGSALDGYSLSEIVLAYRIAMLANEVEAYNGIYGFCGAETFDEIPPMVYTASKTPKIYGGGAIVIEPANGVFVPVEGASENLQYVGITLSGEPAVTMEPTAEPTLEPTIEPTAEPTLEPTIEPTHNVVLTAEPTVEATIEPTVEPTAEITAEPTVEATQEPLPTLVPNAFLACINIDDGETFPGETFDIALKIASPFDTAIDKASFDFAVDTELFTVEKIEISPEFKDIFTCTLNDGRINVSLIEGKLLQAVNVISDAVTVTLTASKDITQTVLSEFTFKDSSYIHTASETETAPEFVKLNASVRVVVFLNENDLFVLDTENKILSGISHGTTLSDIEKAAAKNIMVSAKTSGGNLIHNNDKLSTGAVLTFTDSEGFNKSFTLVVNGDNNEDGNVNSRDIASMQRWLMSGETPEEAYAFASLDINLDERINSKDLSALQRMIAMGRELDKKLAVKPLASSPVVSITASNTTVKPGETFTVTVAFDSVYAKNISVMELIIPINADAFNYVADSATYFIEKTENTIGDALYLSAKNKFFCNYVDVLSPISTKTTTICSFKLTAKQNVDNVISEFKIDSSSFICDADLNDIPYTSKGTTVSVSTSQGLQLVGGSSYLIDSENKYLTAVAASSMAATVISNFTQSGVIAVLKPDGTAVDNDSRVGTGYSVALYASSKIVDKLTVVVSGDVTGDGLANSRDIAALQRHVAALLLLDGAYRAAGDINGDEKINSRDLASLQRLIAA